MKLWTLIIRYGYCVARGQYEYCTVHVDVAARMYEGEAFRPSSERRHVDSVIRETCHVGFAKDE